MYTTIEPRLIALLNTDLPSPSYSNPSLDLPPLNDPNILKASGRPLILEPDAIKRSGKFERSSGLATQHHGLINGTNGEENNGSSTKQRVGKNPTDRALGNSSPQSLRKILDDVNESSSLSSKKRPIPESNKDDFVQLPQPVKKHKAAKQVVPPIIIGLFEPPPQAALFPPIASSSFHDSHGRNTLNALPPQIAEPKDTVRNEQLEELEELDKPETPVRELPKKKDVRSRRKWTEEETNNLLLGVHKHGIGNWTDILEDAAFTFNSRSGADLKDRFRTCCPAELRDSKSSNAPTSAKRVKSTSSLMSENILIDETESGVDQVAGESSSKVRKTKAHRKKLEDLAQLGIEGPFRKSHRRERRLFTEQEDQWILEGYNTHGPAWTKIQRDVRFQLQSRQPTDLRDRFRNKYPEKFRAEKEKEKDSRPLISPHSSSESITPQTSGANGNEQLKPQIPSSTVLQFQDNALRDTVEKIAPSSTYTMTAAHAAPSREGLRIKEILSTSQIPSKSTTHSTLTFPDHQSMDSDPNLPFTQSFDWGNTITAPFSSTMGEMDISRLLLDETWPEMSSVSGRDKQAFTNINSILSSSSEVGGAESTFYGMLEEVVEQVGDGEREGWA